MSTSQTETCFLWPCSWVSTTPQASSCAGCPLTQEALFKSQWKRREESGSEGGGVGFCYGESEKEPVRASMSHLMHLLFILLRLNANLFACLCQRRLRSLCSAQSEPIDPSSAGKNISLCHPPQPLSELYNLPLLSFSVRKKKSSHSCTARCLRVWDEVS